MNRHHTKAKDGRWCTIEVTVENGRLSVTGSEGAILTLAKAKREALAYWRSFFEDSPLEIAAMNERCGTRFTSPASAARYVLENDGELHGLDVHRHGVDLAFEDGKVRGHQSTVLIVDSCGQIQAVLRDWFPEYATLLPWHLNDMHAECTHQQARGETWKTHPSATCPDCGYVLGSAWTKRELPPEIIALAQSVGVKGANDAAA